MILAYAKSDQPTEAEKASVPEKVRWRNGQLWKGEVEPCDVVYTHRDDIAKAYESVEVRPFSRKLRVERNGSWWYVYEGAKEVAKGQGQDNLEAYLNGDSNAIDD